MPHLKMTIKNEGRETSGGPGVRTQSFHCQGTGLILVRKLKTQQAMHHSHIKKKKKYIKVTKEKKIDIKTSPQNR